MHLKCVLLYFNLKIAFLNVTGNSSSNLNFPKFLTSARTFDRDYI